MSLCTFRKQLDHHHSRDHFDFDLDRQPLRIEAANYQCFPFCFGICFHVCLWRRERIFAYLNPWQEDNALGKAYQLSHSLIAFGRGELFGVGLGGSVEKLHYLPEAHTDFLLAVIGEELGFVGVLGPRPGQLVHRLRCLNDPAANPIFSAGALKRRYQRRILAEPCRLQPGQAGPDGARFPAFDYHAIGAKTVA